jgi:hypothetical protein
MAETINQNNNEANTTDKVRRTRRSRKKKAADPLVLEQGGVPPVAAYGQYHPRPAKGALEAASLQYEPPYESPAMEIGQRAEHPEYDTGHPVARPLDVEDEAAA